MSGKVYIIIMIILIGTFLVSINTINNIETTFALFNVESLALRESGDTEEPCGFSFSSSIEYQNCNRNGEQVESPIRQVDTYKCDGRVKANVKKVVYIHIIAAMDI